MKMEDIENEGMREKKVLWSSSFSPKKNQKKKRKTTIF